MKYDEITELYVATAVDMHDGELIEGICGYGSLKETAVKMNAVVMTGRQYAKSAELLHRISNEVARLSGAPVTIRRFVIAEDIYTINPPTRK